MRFTRNRPVPTEPPKMEPFNPDSEVGRLEVAVATYRTALMVYADPRNWSPRPGARGRSIPSVMAFDKGEVARRMLETQGVSLAEIEATEVDLSPQGRQREGQRR